MKKTFFALLAIATLSSCTDNERVKNFGGSAIMEIPFNQKFVNVTWKENELWVLTKQRTNEDTTYNTYHFSEKSSWGVMEGTYTITEIRK
jgi:hypothetical protein